jgi:hypothetical protein
MKNLVTILTMVFTLVLLTLTLYAQDRFDRSATIQADTLDVGGFGEFVAGVDFDGDGKSEIYAVNNDWFDVAGKDLVPRIHKYEQDGAGGWVEVWSTRLSYSDQNTWPPLAATDLDNDGKMEITWGPVNNLHVLNTNPERIVVFETPGDGSDNMGVDNGDGTWRPNAQWTIRPAASNQEELRPFKWIATDIDNDGTQEIVAAVRRDDVDGYGMQIYSVDDVPDAADSTETWTLEFAGLSGTHYDVAVVGNRAYGISSGGVITTVVATAPDTYVENPSQVTTAGLGSWNSATTVDVDGDTQEEILVASWSSSDNDVYLLQPSGDTLIVTKIADVPASSARSYGGAAGDIDNDGNVDFVFGTRGSTPNGVIHRVEYQGGAINDPNSWELSVIDSEVHPAQQYDEFEVVDLDGDGEGEVVYSGTARGAAEGNPQPIVILELIPGNQPIIADVVDVPNDQGRQVWVIWEGSAEDVMLAPQSGNNGTTTVALFGPEDAVFPAILHEGNILTPAQLNPSPTENAQAVISNYVVWRIDNGLPVQVANVVAIQSPLYAAVVPTLGDGAEWEATYVVSAHTADPLTNWKSFPKSGTSEDNLIPTAPTNLIAEPIIPDVQLIWDESPDPDFNYFSIRRGDQAGFDPTDPATEVGTTTEPQFTDTNPGGGTWYYRVVAYDFNGNLGEFSEEALASITGIEDGSEALPKEFALYQNYPNPFNPETQVTFDLPARANVSLSIYNMLGQRVRTLVNDTKPAGTHIIRWDGLNNHGVRVSSGVYIYTIRAGDFVQSKKMTFMK